MEEVAFDVYRPPETPLLTEAFFAELTDDGAVSLSGDQPDDELDQQPVTHDAIAVDAAEAPVPFMGELASGEEPSS
jgi:hypothetical protein